MYFIVLNVKKIFILLYVFSAIGTTYFTYILYGILSAGCSVRYASGIENEYLFSQNMLNTSFAKEMNITQAFNNCTNRDCKYGLIPSQQMIEVIIESIQFFCILMLANSVLRILALRLANQIN